MPFVFNRQKAKAAGYTDQQINDYLVSKQQPTTTPIDKLGVNDGLTFSNGQRAITQDEPKTLEGFAGNVVKSGVDLVKGMGSAAINVINPDMEKNTVANLGRLAIGTGELLVPGEQGSEKYARAVGQMYDDRYGFSDLLKGDLENTKKKIFNTIYKDPVGAALDASIVLGGAGTAAKTAGTLGKAEGLVKAGETLSKASEVIDPLNAVSKAIKPLKASEKVEGVGKTIEETGKSVGVKATKAAGSDINRFESLTDIPFADFQAKEGIYGSAKQMVDTLKQKIEPLQKQYNDLVKTEQPVAVKPYTDALREKAAQLKADNLNPANHAVADSLISRADFIDEQAAKTGGMVTSKVMANTKSSILSKVTPTTMADAAAQSADKLAGGMAIEYLDQVGQGSAAIGKRLQALREFQKIVTKKMNVGKGSQVMNLFKPSAGGAIPGFVLGGVPGAIAGGVIGGAINTPAGESLISQGLQKSGKIVEKAPEVTAKVTKPILDVGKVESRTTPSGLTFANGQPVSFSKNYGNEGQNQNEEASLNTINNNVHDSSLPNSTTGSKNSTPYSATGYTLDQLNQGLANAYRAGDKEAYKEINTLLTIERNAQKDNPNNKTKTTAQQLQDSLGNAIDQLQVLYFDPQKGSLSAGKTTTGLTGVLAKGGQQYKKQFDQEFQDRFTSFNNMAGLAAGIINQARGAGVLNAGEYETMMKNIPNENTSEQAAFNWFNNIRKMLVNKPFVSSLQFSDGTQAIGGQ